MNLADEILDLGPHPALVIATRAAAPVSAATARVVGWPTAGDPNPDPERTFRVGALLVVGLLLVSTIPLS